MESIIILFGKRIMSAIVCLSELYQKQVSEIESR